jgi:hypothetical protein
MPRQPDHNSLIRLALDQVAGLFLEDAADEIEDVSYETIRRWRKNIAAGREPATRMNKETRAALLAFLKRKGIDVSRGTRLMRVLPVNAPAPPTTYEAGALRGFIAGFRVASLRDRPVSEAEAREILDELVDDS